METKTTFTRQEMTRVKLEDMKNIIDSKEQALRWIELTTKD